MRSPWLSQRTGVVVGAGAILVALVAYLLWANYREASRNRQQVLAQHQAAFRLHASALAHLLGSAGEDLRYLADSREVAAYFEGRDLGMSMQYGLGLALIPIRARLQRMVGDRGQGREPRFARVALRDADGLDLAAAGEPFPSPPASPPSAEAEGALVELDADGRHLVVSRPLWSRGRKWGSSSAGSAARRWPGPCGEIGWSSPTTRACGCSTRWAAATTPSRRGAGSSPTGSPTCPPTATWWSWSIRRTGRPREVPGWPSASTSPGSRSPWWTWTWPRSWWAPGRRAPRRRSSPWRRCWCSAAWSTPPRRARRPWRSASAWSSRSGGFEVCERLKADPALRDVPVIFLSALSDTADKVRAFAAGGVDYVTKPFKVEEVTARLETDLALRRARGELERRHRELAEGHARLEKLEHVRSSLVEMIVHDLKNPIAAIQLCADLVRQEGGLNPPTWSATWPAGPAGRGASSPWRWPPTSRPMWWGTASSCGAWWRTAWTTP